MDLSCPKCSKHLPEVKMLQYRFCPHCGAKIPGEPQKQDHTFRTIPPDLPLRQPQKLSGALRPATAQKVSKSRQFNDQTIEPQGMTRRSHPKIRPPQTPPPPGFFRIKPEKKAAPLQDTHKMVPVKSRKKVIIAFLVLLAAVILIIGGLFTF